MAGTFSSAPRLLVLLLIVIAAVGCGVSTRVHAGETLPTLAILPFEINDTSGEVGPDPHKEMLQRATGMIATQIRDAGLFSVVPEAEIAQAIAAVNPGTYLRRCNGCERDIAARVDARYVLTAWINKVSTLVLTFNVDIRDVATGKSVYTRVLDFRGDNETAYTHAIKTMVRSLKQSMEERPRDFGGVGGTKTKIARPRQLTMAGRSAG